MNKRVLLRDLHEHIGSTVQVAGYVDVRRDHGKLVFLDVRDRTGCVQAVALPQNEEALSEAQTLRPEYVVQIEAVVNRRPDKMVQAGQPNGDIELELKRVIVLARAQELPFEKDAALNLDTALDYRPYTLRSSKLQATFRVQHEIIRAFRGYLVEQGFTEFQAPKIVGDDAEGGAEVFRFDYFNDKVASLATSPQLYKQIMVGVYERVFTTGAMFRAERHSTSRHLNEIAMLDFEMGFIDDHTDVMAMMDGMMRYVRTHLAEHAAQDLGVLEALLPQVPEGPIPQLTLREAQELIKNDTGEDKTREPDLDPEDERWLCEYALREHGSDFIFVTHFPTSKRPFYTMADPENPTYSRSFDLLFRGIEILSGSQRVHEYEELVRRIEEKGLDASKFAFYLMAFKYGMPPHGGIGMGLERLTEKMLGLDNVKEAALFPREINRIDTLLSAPEE